MELVELLDKIDETAPRCCKMCVHVGTHEKCADCLSGSHRDGTYTYANYEAGNWLRRLQEWERDGRRDIVIGGQGEAEVNVKQCPRKVSANLHYVAEQCGYMVGRLNYAKADKGLSLTIWTSDGHYRLYWNTADPDQGGKLHHIDTLDSDGKPVGRSWPHFVEG